MPEEILNIAGEEPVAATATQTQHDNTIHAQVGDVSDIVGPGASAEEFLDRYLQAPTELLIPWEDCHLPSGGIYYDWPDGICQVKAMGQTAEKILATQRLAASGQSIDYLFRECCRFPQGFDPSELLLGDRIFLLYYLRGITHGNLYEFAVICPNPECETTNTHTYDLNDLASTIVRADAGLGTEPFRVSLPYASEAAKRDMWVELRFLRAYDANEIIARRKTKKKVFARPGGVRNKTQGVDPREQQRQNLVLDTAIEDNLEKMIVSVLGVTDRLKIRQFVQKLHARDTATIREWIREHTPGIDNTVEVVCPDCGNDFTIELPITESFFRPAKR